ASRWLAGYMIAGGINATRGCSDLTGLPAIQRRLVIVFRGDPAARTLRADFALPEGGAGFQPIHQEIGCVEGRTAVPGGCCDHHDRLALVDASVAMHDKYVGQVEA